MKKRNGKKSIRKRLFIFMLLVSFIPIIIISVFADVTAYNIVSKQNIDMNNESITWAEDRFEQFAKELKSVFYSMEFDKSFREGIMKWNEKGEAFEDIDDIRQILNQTLNKNQLLTQIELYMVNQKTLLQVNRAGIKQVEDTDWLLETFAREKEEQTNLYLKYYEGNIYAVHNVNTFKDRKLVAHIAIRLRDAEVIQLLQKVKSRDEESIYLYNDKYELLNSITDGSDHQQLLTQVIEILKNGENTKAYYEIDKYLVFIGKIEKNRITLIKVISKGEIAKTIIPLLIVGLIIGIVCLLIATILSAIFSFKISKPIIQLTQNVKAIKMEELKFEAQIYEQDEIAVLGDHISKFIQRIKELIHYGYEAELQAKSAQIKALQAQMNPHFLHNTLQLMGSIALSGNVKKVYNIVGALSCIMRYSMDFQEEYVTIRQELKHLDNYFLIQKERFGDKFIIETNIQKEVYDCMVPKLFLQPVVENSFTHGFEKSTSNWHLVICASLVGNDKVRIVITDNGIGMTKEELEDLRSKLKKPLGSIKESKHIGLSNINNRIKLYYSEEDGLEVQSSYRQGTTVTYTFDVKIKGGEENDI